MQHSLLLALLVAVGVAAGDSITTKFDNVDLDRILGNERLVNNYVNCLLDRGRCTPDGAELKKNLPDALQNECGRCSEKQKSGAEKAIRHLAKNYPEQWKLLQEKYDPRGIYHNKYSARL